MDCRRLRSTLCWVIMVSALLSVAIFAVPVHVAGSSMEPTLPSDTWVLVSPLVAIMRQPTRGEMAVVRHPYRPSAYIIKRVIAVPGDCVSAQDGAISVNGQRQSEPFVHSAAYYTIAQRCLTCDELFVLGDNRADSVDSARWGALPRRNVVGIVILRKPR